MFFRSAGANQILYEVSIGEITGELYRCKNKVTDRRLGKGLETKGLDEWTTVEVIAEANRLKIIVNGMTTTDVLEDVNVSRCGQIGLCVNNQAVEFRKIEIKELTPAAAITNKDDTKNPPQKEPEQKPTTGKDRKAAELVFSLGGRVVGEDRKMCRTAKELPAGPWMLRRIYSYSSLVTDKDLKALDLPGLKGLDSLYIRSPKVTDAGLKELAGVTGLKTLEVDSAQVTDAGLKELAGLKSLQSLGLQGTQATDAGLKELAGLKSLQMLGLQRTKVTDAGLKELARLTALYWLSLDSTKVTDTGLKELTGFKSLQFLSLRATQVTDAGLKELVGLKGLQNLDLRNTKVTTVGVAQLRKALPSLQIQR